jgi:hypothetical protein
MKVNSLGAGREMVEIDLQEALNLAGVYHSDTEFERDLKLNYWIGKRRHRCIEFDVVSYSADLEHAAADGIEVLIIKEK